MKQNENEFKILVSSNSPVFDISAIVEQNKEVAYFYLTNSKSLNLKMKSCWIKNFKKNKENNIVEQMQSGFPPILPDKYVLNTYSIEPLLSNTLEIVWFEEGDAAALLENEEIIAIIPSWSGENGFYGYSKYCKKENLLVFPLVKNNILIKRIHESKKFWEQFTVEDYWNDIQDRFLERFKEMFNAYSEYYAIDNGNFPPKALIQIEYKNINIAISIGNSIIPQPTVELFTENYNKINRVELCFSVSDKFPKVFFKKMLEYISSLSNIPWNSYTWIGNGHTILCDILKEYIGEEFNSIILISTKKFEINFNLEVFNKYVEFLWIVPITFKEQEFAIEYGSDKLINMLLEKGVTNVFSKRKSIIL